MHDFGLTLAAGFVYAYFVRLNSLFQRFKWNLAGFFFQIVFVQTSINMNEMLNEWRRT